MSLPYVILTFNAEDLSKPVIELAIDGIGLRGTVVPADDIDETDSGMDEIAFVNVDVPVVGREKVTGDIGDCGVTGESDSLSNRLIGSGGGSSLPRLRFV